MATAARRPLKKIKPVRKHGHETSVSETWAALSNAIREIHKNNASNLSYEENYRYCYNLVLTKQGAMMYEGVNTLIGENVDRLAESQVLPAFPTGVSTDPMQRVQEDERLLKAVTSVWEEHFNNMSKLRDLLKYMDRVYTPSAQVPAIWDSGMIIFLQHMIKAPYKQHIIDAILSQVNLDREGYPINRSAVKSCVVVLVQLSDLKGGPSVYKRDLEPSVLTESEVYYKAEAERLLQSCDAPEYLRKVEMRFLGEEDRAHHYLSSQTAAPLKKILENTLLSPHLSTILSMESGIESMIDLDKIDDLARLYRLFVKVPNGQSCMRKAIRDIALRRGKDLNEGGDADLVVIGPDGEEEGGDKTKSKGRGGNSADVATKWVENVLSLKDRFDAFLKLALSNDREIEATVNEAFETFVNLNPRAPEYISLFIDDNLKKGLKGKTDQEVDVVLDKTIAIFRYITEKDMFERYYKSHLAKRLLQGRSVSDDAERGMLAKLKVECGFQFTRNMEGMFKDVKVSADTMESYKRHLTKATMRPDFDIIVTVMTATHWPSIPSPSCVFPEIMTSACTSFQRFYLSQHSGRRLTWQPGLGTADVRVQFKARKHDLNVSTLALVVLLRFEDVPEGEFLTYEELQDGTSIPEADLKRTLQSLACAKFKILKKHPPSRDVHNDDSFSFNNDFSSPLQRIKIGTVSARVESNEERSEMNERVDEERRLQTEACIVRVMKARRHITHNKLINEVTRQLSTQFRPNPLNIKKRIEALIEREYIERCDDRKSYNYLA